MARPLKVGIDYFPTDVDIDQDDKVKMVKNKYGLMGMGTVLMLLAKVYKNGYFYHWTEREQELFCGDYREEVNVVNNVVNECIKWGLFDKNVYEHHQVLTSSGIQKRYLLAVERRKDKHIIDEYWLIEKDVNADSNGINVNNNSDNAIENPVNADKSTQSKVNKTKVNETNKSIIGTKVPERTKFKPPSLEEVTEYCYQRGNRVDPENWYDHYTANGWKVGKNPMKDWKAAVRTWEKKNYSYSITGNNQNMQINKISPRLPELEEI